MPALIKKLLTFINDYGKRHAHPTNALLHLVGVPLVIISIYFVCTRLFMYALILFFLGYFLQYLGHRAQGNEVGEVMLFKHLWQFLHRSQRSKS